MRTAIKLILILSLLIPSDVLFSKTTFAAPVWEPLDTWTFSTPSSTFRPTPVQISYMWGILTPLTENPSWAIFEVYINNGGISEDNAWNFMLYNRSIDSRYDFNNYDIMYEMYDGSNVLQGAAVQTSKPNSAFDKLSLGNLCSSVCSPTFTIKTYRQLKNKPPALTLSPITNSLLANEPGFSSFQVKGFVSDPDGDSLTVTSTIAGVTKSTAVTNTTSSKPFTLNFDVINDNIPVGTHTVYVTVDDGKGGTANQTLSITVKTRAKDNLYVLVGDSVYYNTTYSDAENDAKIDERWLYTHDPNFFENPTETIVDSGQWRGTPYTSFSKPGHYTVNVQGKDQPTIDVGFEPFQKWSQTSFTTLNIYVHRRPVASYTVSVYSNGSGGFIVTPNDSSYDLDKQSGITHGIAQWEWKWKYSWLSTWTNGLPPQTIVANTTYQMQLRVLDEQGAWSLPVVQSFNTFNVTTPPPPTATMTDPNGTQAIPTIISITTPTFTWSQTSSIAGMVFKQYQIQVTDAPNSTMIYDSGILNQNTSNTSQSFTMPSNLPVGQPLRVRVKVADSNGTWSNWSAQTWFMINSAPTGNVTFATPIYQNDTPTFTITQSDPDYDSLTITVDASFNGGSFTNIMQWTGIPSGTTKTFSYGPLAQGTYQLRLTLDDGKGGAFSNVYSFTVLPLGIIGSVSHTTDWENYRLDWNTRFPSQLRTVNVFWAGEAFELSAIVTDTGSSTTKPTQVSVNLIETGDSTTLASMDGVHFTGEMLNTDFARTLNDGQYTARFNVNWSNGLVQTYDVPIEVKGNMYDVLVTQLRN